MQVCMYAIQLKAVCEKVSDFIKDSCDTTK